MPLENAFRVLDEGGVTCGSAAVVEYINHALLPERPLNYYISINAHNQRAFDMLMGAAVARSLVLRRRNARMPARIYAPCPPFDAKSLRDFLDFGFQNDDAVIRMRHILTAGDHLPNPPVGCALAPVMLEEAADYDALLTRLNAYSAVAHGPEWLARLRQEPLFAVCGVWQEERLLGELVLTGYGAEGQVEMLYTHPTFRRRGVARALLAEAGRILLENGIRSLSAEVWRRTRAAMGLFEAMRFESVAPTILYPGVDI